MKMTVETSTNRKKGFSLYNSDGSVRRVVEDVHEMQSIFSKVLHAFEKEQRKLYYEEEEVEEQQQPQEAAVAEAAPRRRSKRQSSRDSARRGGKSDDGLVSLTYSYGGDLDWDAIAMCWKPKQPQPPTKKRKRKQREKQEPAEETATTAETSTSESSSSAAVVTQEDFIPEAVSSSSRKRPLEIDSSDEDPASKRSQGGL
jgi:hypothetical protein